MTMQVLQTMRRRQTVLAVLAGIFSVLACVCARATGLQLFGEFAQGGLVYGTTWPDARVFFDGHRLPVAPDGSFVFGFGRDAAAHAVLRVDTGALAAQQILSVRQRRYDTQRIDGLPPQMVTPAPGVRERIRAEAQLIRRARLQRSFPDNIPRQFVWPLHGTITGVYGSSRVLNGRPRQPHFGVDIACPSGTPVRASAAGIVTLVHPDLYFTGMTVVIDHGYGVSSTLLHLSAMLVAAGDTVKQGDIIARVGSSGRSTGAHLDWRVNWRQARLDPALLAGPMPQDALCARPSRAAK